MRISKDYHILVQEALQENKIVYGDMIRIIGLLDVIHASIHVLSQAGTISMTSHSIESGLRYYFNLSK